MVDGHEGARRRVPAWVPLGRALLCYHHGDTDTELEVHTDMWETEREPVAVYYRPDAVRLPPLERRALALCRGRVLDVGAGAGRHALELQRQGFEVTALDVADEAVEVMRRRGVTDARQGDIFSLGDERFDTLLLMMHGLGVFGDVAGLARFLESARKLLSPGGQILGDSADLGRAFPGIDFRHSRASHRYPGEVEYRLVFGALDGAPYSWLFIDSISLTTLARAAGYSTEIVTRGPRGCYLARLT